MLKCPEKLGSRKSSVILTKSSLGLLQHLQLRHWSVRAMLCTYFATLVLVGLLFSPEKQDSREREFYLDAFGCPLVSFSFVQVSTGVHQQFGSCNATDIDLLGYERKLDTQHFFVFERFGRTVGYLLY